MLVSLQGLLCLCLLPLALSEESQTCQAQLALCRQGQDTASNSSLQLVVERPSKAEVWGYGILMVTVISLASVAGVAVLPIMSKSFYSKLMTGLIGLAVGSLAASAVFHLIPGAFRHLLLILA